MQLYIHKCVRRTTINIMTNRLHTNRPFESMLLHLLTDEPIEQCRNKSGTGTGLCTWKRWTDVGNKWLELRQLRVITYVIEHMYAARSVASFSIPPPRMHSGKHKSWVCLMSGTLQCMHRRKHAWSVLPDLFTNFSRFQQAEAEPISRHAHAQVGTEGITETCSACWNSVRFFGRHKLVLKLSSPAFAPLLVFGCCIYWIYWAPHVQTRLYWNAAAGDKAETVQ